MSDTLSRMKSSKSKPNPADRFVWQPGDLQIVSSGKKGVKTKSKSAAEAFAAVGPAMACDDHCTACSSCRAKNAKR